MTDSVDYGSPARSILDQRALAQLKSDIGPQWHEILTDLRHCGLGPEMRYVEDITVNFTGLDTQANTVQALGRKLLRRHGVDPDRKPPPSEPSARMAERSTRGSVEEEWKVRADVRGPGRDRSCRILQEHGFDLGTDEQPAPADLARGDLCEPSARRWTSGREAVRQPHGRRARRLR